MCNWCLELLRLIMSSLSSCVTDVWTCSDLLCLVCVHVYLMSGVAQTYCVLSEFMCNWCLELLRLIVSSLSSCVTDVWSWSYLLCLVWSTPDKSYTWTQRGHNKREQLQTSVTREHIEHKPDISYTWTQTRHNKYDQHQTSDTHELREDTISLSNSRHQLHMNTDQGVAQA
jgi:hypothetical protein